MKNIYSFFLALTISPMILGQVMTLNNNVFVVIDNGAKIVVANASPSAISVLGSGGNIVSESEADQVIWQIGNSTGTYSLPFTTKPVVQGGNGTKIPLTVNITSGGDASGKIAFSTYETSNDWNSPFPSGITNLNNSSGQDASLYTIDRFWILDNTSYSTKPSASLSFAYDDAVNETGGSNLLLESDLKAQRFNNSNSNWECIQLGNVNTVSNVVSNVPVNSSTFWKTWTLQSVLMPLAINLTSFNSSNENCKFRINWEFANANEIENFIVENSIDGESWEILATIQAVSESGMYEFIDEVPTTNGLSYYRLSTINLNGIKEIVKIVSSQNECDSNEIVIYPNPFNEFINISTNEISNLKLVNNLGQTLLNQNLEIGITSIDLQFLSNGCYIATVDQKNGNSRTIKIIKQ